MKIVLTLVIYILFFSSLFAQEKDSLSRQESYFIQINTKKIQQPELIQFQFTKVYKEFNLDALNIVAIRKSLLDSLLLPYYTKIKDSVTGIYSYIPKHRMKVSVNKQDTSYVPLPKKHQFIRALPINRIDSLVIVNKVDSLKFDRAKKLKEPDWWIRKNSIGLDINQVAFVNWNAGGENSIAGILKIYLGRNFEKMFTLWTNEISIRYGLNQVQDKGLIKTDDEVTINSTFGYRKQEESNWYYSAKFNFRTQFTDGFKYPNTKDPISRFFAPAYLLLGVGAQYNITEKHFSVYISPLTLKSTFVADKVLSDEGAFGVEPGKSARNEFGILFQSKWDTELFKNVAMRNRFGLYTDYLNNFGNIDVNWELNFKFKINDFFEANLGSHLFYDDDIKHKEDTNGDGNLETVGPRVQFKQQLGIGVLYSF